jgi:hypothetical protein
MAETPADARKTTPLKRLLQDLNQPGGQVSEINEEVLLKDLEVGISDVDKKGYHKILAGNFDCREKHDDTEERCDNNSVDAWEMPAEQPIAAKPSAVTHVEAAASAGRKNPLAETKSDDEFLLDKNESSDGSDSEPKQSKKKAAKKRQACNTKKTMVEKKKPPKASSNKKKRLTEKQTASVGQQTTTTLTTTMMPAAAPDSGSTTENISPSLDVPKATFVNTLEMERNGAFDAGYDTDGSLGPERGTHPEEIKALEEDAVTVTEPTNAAKVEIIADIEEDAPKHVPMAEGDTNALNVNGLKEQLKLRRVPFKSTLKKAELIAKLREALDQERPCYTQQQLNNLDKKNADSKKKVNDMKDFAVGAYWELLEPMEDEVDEPLNNNFPGARPPTKTEEEARIQPRPKHNYNWTCDRPQFTGKPSGKSLGPDEQPRTKGRPKQEFLDRHFLDKDSTPVEWAEAFFPMYKNQYEDKNGDPYPTMADLANWTNIRIYRAFCGDATSGSQF